MIKEFRHRLEWQPWWVILALGVVFAGCFGAAEQLASLLMAHKQPWLMLPLSYLATLGFLFYALLTILAVCRVKVSAAQEIGLALLFFVGIIVFHPMLLSLVVMILGNLKILPAPLKAWAAVPGLVVLGNMCVILTAGFLGRLVGRIVREANMLLIVTVVAAAIDFWGVYWGPVGHITKSEGGAAIAQQLSAALPAASAAAKTGLPVLAAIGIGDFLFLAVFFSVLRRLQLNQRVTFWATLVIMSVAPVFFLLGDKLPIASNLPGLPFIAIGTIATNWRHFKFSQEEKRILVVGALIVAAVIAGIIILMRLI